MSGDGTEAGGLIHDLAAAQAWIKRMRAAGKRIGIVPTMGALHEGHLSLVRASQAACDVTAVTIFVNPTQFGPHEDLERYPRTLDADRAKLNELNVDVVFAPQAAAIYPSGYSTYVEPPAIAGPLEGRLRPGHFRGVATVVLKLFQILPADAAFFGQKDYQQSLVVRHMVRDLNVPIAIEVCPTVRESDGLAMSSRNQYLSADERQRATSLYRSLRLGERLLREGARNADEIKQAMRKPLTEGGILEEAIDYIALADPDTLEERATVAMPAVLLLAARVGNTRLIDNWIVSLD